MVNTRTFRYPFIRKKQQRREIMWHNFEGEYLKEGNRHFLKIPFNVWEICGQKGNLPVAATVENIPFECKLIPKGEGKYYLPVAKKIIAKLPKKARYQGSFKVIDQLTRINHNSPYSQPIRKVDTIELVKQPEEGLCGQACMAMLTRLPIDDIITIMDAKKWQASLSKVIETLDYFKFTHAEKMIYKKEAFNQLPNLCLLNVKSPRQNAQYSHLLIYFNGKYYDPASGIHTHYDSIQIISYLELFNV